MLATAENGSWVHVFYLSLLLNLSIIKDLGNLSLHISDSQQQSRQEIRNGCERKSSMLGSKKRVWKAEDSLKVQDMTLELEVPPTLALPNAWWTVLTLHPSKDITVHCCCEYSK